MSSVVTQVQTGPASEAQTVLPQKSLGKDAFIKLLLTQMQNQDPLNPLDNAQMIAQLAQFSSVEQLQGLGSRLDTLLLAQASSNQLQTASLVGKDVLYHTTTMDLPEGGTASGQVVLPAAANVTATVKDGSGNVVRVLQLGSRAAGNFDFTWDGRDGGGLPLAAGSYQVDIEARDASGKAVQADLRCRGRVQGVSFDSSGAAVLLVGLARSTVKLADVMEINQP
jgi:flagellar basal-body rod modification protein FlgD